MDLKANDNLDEEEELEFESCWDKMVDKVVKKFKDTGIPDVNGHYEGTISTIRYCIDDLVFLLHYRPSFKSLSIRQVMANKDMYLKRKSKKNIETFLGIINTMYDKRGLPNDKKLGQMLERFVYVTKTFEEAIGDV